MRCPYTAYTQLDKRVTEWMTRYGVRLLRVGLGVVIFWFGLLKLFPGSSPAPGLTARAIELLTFGTVSPVVSMPALALWECGIGVGLIANLFMRATLLLLFARMLGGVSSLLLFPHEAFVVLPFTPTVEGQQVIKNIVLLGAALVTGATVRGGRVVSNREKRRAEFTRGRRRRADRMRAPFPPSVLAFVLFGGLAALLSGPGIYSDTGPPGQAREVNERALFTQRRGRSTAERTVYVRSAERKVLAPTPSGVNTISRGIVAG